MGFFITLCTVHTTQGQGTIVFCCAHPGPCLGPGPVPVLCSVYEPLGPEIYHLGPVFDFIPNWFASLCGVCISLKIELFLVI